ncbi:MAG: NDP-hexose 3-C-methyltransferase [Candidatus Roizmanbacteria bacterium GW2011_GWA2_37_7]|uniref:NDP-hexose 3-C-methyltransferase n=1 Tax=Candidatus Roizmanbacteria bacterium GW2011_GWA2_37_7 TaxID=1618481 RepID=A0A0G0JPI5_9BACT|nr:MAG: NDP-hexose 3-C-methyltransferase [Candidatus Roizmanbacteria bacterium GW2011_GWA2_37_7]
MQDNIIKKLKKCRVCKNTHLTKVFTLGPTPLANAFLTEKQIDEPESFYPLDVYFCQNCSFVQLGHVVSPEILFKDYVYVSSTSPVFVNHFKNFAKEIVTQFSLNNKALVIDIGSNDGILLKPFLALGTRVLGIEPASHIAKEAEKQGIETIDEFFSVALAKNIVKKKGKAKVVTANNVFAHIHDLDEVIKGLDVLLDDEGVFITESPYLIDFLKKRYFDLVYHEHLSYWSLSSLMTLFKRFDMEVFDIQKVDVHGGTIRTFIKRKKAHFAVSKNVDKFLQKEKKSKLKNIETYQNFSKKILENRRKLIGLLTKLKLYGKRIVGYGAPAKGNTLLNYFKIGPEILDYIVEDSHLKVGLYTPGTHIPIVSSKQLQKDNPDYVFILAWNFAPSIQKKLAWFKKRGKKFIIPVPQPKIV